MHMLKLKNLLFIGAIGFELTAAATEIRIPFSTNRWEAPGNIEFINHKGVSAMRIPAGVERVVLKEVSLANGVVEFDVEPTQPGFVGLYFRYRDPNENECFYLRTQKAGDSTAPEATQYAPIIKGVNLWDLLPHYQSPAAILSNDWNHVKLVISGARLRVFVNNASKPVIEAPQLEGANSSGSLAFFGAAIFANLVIRPDEVEGLPSEPGPDPTANDPRYLRNWKVSAPFELNYGREPLGDGDVPKRETRWESIAAERRGLVNLSRQFGKSDTRRTIWLKTVIRSSRAQIKKADLGFSDEVWVLINGKLLYTDKNLFLHPIRKQPEGRCALENGRIEIPLQAGDNELVVGVANDFFGWGLMARLENLEDIQLGGQ